MAQRIGFLTLRALRTELKPCFLPQRICSPVVVRQMSDIPPVPESIRKKQDLFQTGEEMPVFVKGGLFDNVLYKFTMGTCVLSVLLIFKLIFDLANPKKK